MKEQMNYNREDRLKSFIEIIVDQLTDSKPDLDKVSVFDIVEQIEKYQERFNFATMAQILLNKSENLSKDELIEEIKKFII